MGIVFLIPLNDKYNEGMCTVCCAHQHLSSFLTMVRGVEGGRPVWTLHHGVCHTAVGTLVVIASNIRPQQKPLC